MNHWNGKTGRLIVALILWFGVAAGLIGCRAMMWRPATGAVSDAFSGRKIVSDPFKPVDPISYTKSKAASALLEYRIKPAAAVVGQKPLELIECRNLAIGSNLELQAARMDEISKQAIEFSNRTKLLPHFLASAELGERDNLAYSYSDQGAYQGNAPDFSPVPSGSVSNWAMGRERSTWRYVLEMRWSPTDAILAYYLTLSSGNERLTAHFQKVRVAQKLVGVVDAAFFRLLSLQQCGPMARNLSELRADILSRMERLLERKLKTVDDCERARQSHVKARALAAMLENETQTQINILASAMGVSPDKCAGLTVVGNLPEPVMDECITNLEMIAVQQRPEAYQAGLNSLNSVNDLKRSIVKSFPKVTGYWRTTHDKDKYILNKEWTDVGMMVYFDLLDFISTMGETKASRARTVKTDREIGAVALGITSQVRIAALKTLHALTQLRNAEMSVKSALRVYRTAQKSFSANASDKLSQDEARAAYLGEEVARLRALGEANALLAELHGAMGTNYSEPLPKD